MAKIGGKLGVINDVSDSGLLMSTNFAPKNKKVDVSIELNGQTINIPGLIQWVKWKHQTQDIYQVGIYLTQVPPEFTHFVSQLVH